MIDLKAYDLSCGKVQKENINVTYLYYVTIELYKEHNVYHVRAFNHFRGSSVSDRLAWDTYNKVKDARKRYKELKKIYRGEN